MPIHRQNAKAPNEKSSFVEPSAKADARAKEVLGCSIEVHKHIVAGYSESVYEEALCHELALRGIPFTRQVGVDVIYKGKCVGKGTIDLLVDDELIVELKAVDAIRRVVYSG